MNAVIYLDVPDWQIGQDVAVYFPDTMMKHGKCELLKEQEAKPPVHLHEEYPEHDWERKENGDIDNFAYEGDFHNGPMCKRCYYSFCIHCDPDGWNEEPCIIDEYKCPKCGKYISKGIKFCSDCGQEVKWDGSDRKTLV